MSPVVHPLLNMQFESEFRRFNVDRTKMTRFDAFSDLVRGFFRLTPDMHITMSYTDPRNSDLLPINNDDNLQRAFSTAMPLLKVFIYREQGGWVSLGRCGSGWATYMPTLSSVSTVHTCHPCAVSSTYVRMYVHTYVFESKRMCTGSYSSYGWCEVAL